VLGAEFCIGVDDAADIFERYIFLDGIFFSFAKTSATEIIAESIIA